MEWPLEWADLSEHRMASLAILPAASHAACHWQDQHGAYPVSGDTQRGFLAETAPLDPFTGMTPTYRRTDSGFERFVSNPTAGHLEPWKLEFVMGVIKSAGSRG